ncbi:MBL fold metallo-hydrolase [Geothrix sp.]|uniref:MBL fold metallo-hydrolase n=1 Tax=Geothrix sp. TaxID=1962974 RepID=UPI0025C03BFE|nr:MBL fold metallo-hydrolase [Geothrix sp.]WIL22402.1 MAG: MBL fold metallo-hydrolase [Geothrix sp.]
MRTRSLLISLLLPLAAMTQSATEPARMKPSHVAHLRLGQMQVWVLQDGRLSLEASLLKDIGPAEARRMLGGQEAAVTPVNAFLVRLSGKTVLVDTGMGKDPDEDSGHLAEQLEAAGVQPGEIDLILITHYHFDHIGGLLKTDGTRAFPHAQLCVPRSEHDFWLQEPSRLPERLRGRIPKLKALFAVYEGARALRAFEDGVELAPGLRAMAAHGHAGGHTAYAFTSEGHELWCIGDLIHFGAVQFERPEVGISYDLEGRKAVETRRSFFQRAAHSKVVLAGAHLPRLVGIEAKGAGYVAVPVLQ